MDEGLKKRLIGASVLASLAVLFVPMLFEAPPPRQPEIQPLPEKPPMRDFAAEMLTDEVPAVVPLAPRDPVVEARNDDLPPPSAARPAPGLKAWMVQVGSFSSRENALRLVQKLRRAKLPTPDPDLVSVGGKRYYRVRVGPVVERSEAEQMRTRASELADIKATIRRYPG